MTDYFELFGYALSFWLAGFVPAYLMCIFKKGMEISI